VKKPKHIAQIHTRKKRSLQNAQEQRIKEGYYRYPGESYLRITRNKLVYTYVLKDIQKNIYKIGRTMTLMPGLRACVLGESTSIALVNKTLKIFCSTLITE
jgi:hypothetical protein